MHNVAGAGERPVGRNPGLEGGNMTAETAGKAAVDGVWATLRHLREQWMLITFLAGAAFWIRDIYDEFAPLPALMREQMRGLSQLEATVTRLEGQVKQEQVTPDQGKGNRSPVLGFPGNLHSVDDGAPGAWIMLHWRPVRSLRGDCVPTAINAWMVDADGAWFAVETRLAPMPVLEGEQELAFGLRVHPGMVPGRARVLVQIVFECGSHRQVETAPWLQFRVLAD